MNIDFGFDSFLHTANVGIIWIVLLFQFSIAPKCPFSTKQKAVIYAGMTLISFVVATSKTVVLFDVIAFLYYSFFSVFFWKRSKKGK